MPPWKTILTIDIRLKGHVLAKGFGLSRRPARLGSVSISKLEDCYQTSNRLFEEGEVDVRRA